MEDAFSNLLTGSLASSSSKNMTIAQQAALAEKERTDKYLKGRWEARREAMAWDGIDLLGLGSTGTGTVQSKSGPGAGGDDWGLGFAANGSSSGSSTNRAADDDDWGLEDFVSAPTTKPKSGSQSLWDLDEFTSQSQNAPPSHAYKSANADFDFDFGDREDRLLPTASHGDEDDILGVLSKPVDSIQKRPSPVRLY
jgi:hypothetical protein